MSHRGSRSRRITTGLAVIMLMAGPPASAQQGGAPDRPAAAALAPQIERMHEVALAYRLADYGRTRSDPFALTTAAGILLREPLTAPAALPEGAAAARDTASPVLDWLDRARRLAADQPPLLDRIARLRDVAMATARGAEGGIRTGGATLPPLGVHRYEITFVGGQPAAVYIAGLGRAPLRCAVFDDAGKRVASDSGEEAQCLVTWWPSRRGSYRVEVRNAERLDAEYLFMTN
jgi:hypothetical protein